MGVLCLLRQGAETARVHMVLAHGAGAPMTSPFMEGIALLLAGRGICVTRFEFAYMAAQRAGERRPPPKAERLRPEYEAVVERLAPTLTGGQTLVIGGKSMGGRVASLIAADLYARGRIAGLVCLSYPFHPPGKQKSLRTLHLESFACPTLIVQGERDPFGTRAEVEGYPLAPAIRVHWIGDADHDLAPGRRSETGRHAQNLAAAADAIKAFAEALPPPGGDGAQAAALTRSQKEP
jgi:hypothetical protein